MAAPMRLTIGIDPGVHGAIAVLGLDAPFVVDCPAVKVKINKTMRTRCDPMGMALVIGEYLALEPESVHVFLEKVHANPKQGVASMFTFGEALGLWQGILAALVVPYTLVTPQAWKKGVMAGMTTDKDAGRVRAVQLWPELHGKLGPKAAGRADALLIAEYGRRIRW